MALYDQWQGTLEASPEAIALCNALDSFIEAGIEGGDVEQAYRDLVMKVQEGEGSRRGQLPCNQRANV